MIDKITRPSVLEVNLDNFKLSKCIIKIIENYLHSVFSPFVRKHYKGLQVHI